MARRFEDLQKIMAEYNKAIRIGTNRLVQTAAMTVQETVARNTPVDTGKARSNWRVSINSLLFGETNAYAPYPKRSGPKLGETSNANAAIAQGYSRIRRFNVVRHGTVVVQNNSPYIGKLNDGTQSAQASNFVELAVVTTLAKIKSMRVINGNVRF